MTRPPIVDELGRELVRAARADEARSKTGGRVALARAPRAFVGGVLALLGLAAVAAAATLIAGRADPIPAARPADVPRELRPVPGTARLNGLALPDPDGGPAWDVRTSRSRTGAVCAAVGQVLDGELGLLGLDRRFRVLPAGAADTCSTPQRTGATLAGARAFRGGGPFSPLTVVNGVAAPGVRQAIAIAGGRAVRMRLGPGHAFLAIFRGLPEEVRPRVVLTEASGRRTVLRFADRGEFIASDPSGGTPWALRYIRGASGLRCVAAQRQRGPDSPTPVPDGSPPNVDPASVPSRCGPRRRAFVAIRRFVPRVQVFSRSFRWGLNPARTVVWGAVPRGAGAIVLTGAGAPRRLRVDGRRGGFLAVLSGRVDPRELHLRVGGRALDPRAATGRRGQPVAAAPVPAWRSVASVARRVRWPNPVRPNRPSIAISRRAQDPTGGPAWALRSWTARLRQPAAAITTPGGSASGGVRRPARIERLACYAIGIERGDRLVEPRLGGAERTVGSGSRDARCTSGHWMTLAFGVEVRTYVDDPQAPDPRPQRVVVAGLLGGDVRSAQLLGAGAPRPLALGRHGTFLLVLGPEHAGAPMRIRQVGRDGRVRTSAPGDLMVGCRPRPGRSVRVADPDGGPSWTAGLGTLEGPSGLTVSRTGDSCEFSGRLVSDHLAALGDGEPWVRYRAASFSSVGGAPARSSLRLDVQGPGWGPEGGDVGPLGQPSQAQIARRTLPGRTIVSGRAGGAVTAITLRTPRDVRTVIPAPGGVFLAVYDGPFYGGVVEATAHLRNGGTVTRRMPLGAY